MDDKIQALSKKERYTFDDLRDVMEILRSEQGCPWDREQTHLSIRENLIEEAYEVIEGIDNADRELLKEELGDVLFQIMFHSRIEEEQNSFSIDEVIDGISRKMVHRHPHIFADRHLETSSEVLDAWDKIKAEEKSRLSLSTEFAVLLKSTARIIAQNTLQPTLSQPAFAFSAPFLSLFQAFRKMKYL